MKKTILTVLMLFVVAFVKAQVTTLLSSTVNNGGFEQGITGWELQSNTGLNKWAMGSIPSAGFTGNSCAFISNSTSFPLLHQFSASSGSITKFYKNVVFPANTSNYKLSFKLRMGNAPNTYLLVYLLPESEVLNPNEVSYGSSLGSYSTQSNVWEEKSITISNTLLGNTSASVTKKLVFIWYNSSTSVPSSGLPAAIDDVTIDNCTKPINVTAIGGSTELTVNWDSPDTSWKVQYKKASETTWNETIVSAKPYTISGLLNSTVYNVQIKNNILSCNDWSTLYNFTTTPPNNSCQTALQIDAQEDISSQTEVVANFTGATLSTPTPQCTYYDPWSGNSVGDMWFKFTANANRYILDGNSNLKVELFTATDCSNMTYQYCRNGLGYLDNLTNGTQYYIRLINNNINNNSYSNNQKNFRLVKSPDAQPNDACLNAVELLPNVGVSSNLVGSTLETPISTYTTNVLGDVWFKFVATEAYHTIQASATNTMFTSKKLKILMYKGDCTNLISFQDLYEFDSYSGGNTKDTNLLEIGATYYLRVYYENVAENWSFGIKTIPRPAPLNDTCNGAINIPLDADGETQFSFQYSPYSTPSIGIPTTCQSYSAKDIWYKITPTTTKYIVTSGNQITIYSGSCDALVQVNCGTSFVLNNLTIGQHYFVRAFNSSSVTFREFTAEDECTTATELFPSLNPTYVYSSTVNATPSAGSTVKDVWFKFIASSSKQRVELLNASSYGSELLTLNAYSGNCNNLNTLTFQSINYQSGSILPNLIVGQTYYIKISRQSSLYFGIRIKHINTQPNDLIENAITIIPDNQGVCNFISGSTEGAEPSIALNATCSGNNSSGYKDVWYSFVATEQRYKIDKNTAQNCTIYKETSPTTIELFICDEGSFSLFEVGTKYYVRIARYISSDTTPQQEQFSFCISNIIDAPLNDECVNAIIVTPSSTPDCTNITTGNITFATYNINNPIPISCSGGNSSKDVWYKFTATSDKMILTNKSINNLINGVNYTYGFNFRVFNSNCSNFICTVNDGSIDPQEQKILKNLTIGNEYLIKITISPFTSQILDYIFSSSNNFSFCLSTPPPVTNDLCENPTIITPSTSLDCGETITNYTGIASPSTSLNVSCGIYFQPYTLLPAPYSNYNDRWYQFVATNSEHFLDFVEGNIGDDIEKVQLFSGNCNAFICHSSTSIYDSNGVLFSNLIIGETYTFRIIEDSFNPFHSDTYSSYTFCLKTPTSIPANDEYINAINLVSSPDLDTCNATSYTFNRASYSSNVPYNVFPYDEKPDVWYKFIATAPNHQLQIYYSNTNINFNTFSTVLYSSNNSVINQVIYQFNPFDTVLGISNTGVSISSGYYYPLTLQNYTNLVVGETYYVRLIGNEDVQGGVQNIYRKPINFDLCLKTLPEIPINKEMNNAIDLSVSDANNLEYISGYSTRGVYSNTLVVNNNPNFPCYELSAIFVPTNIATNAWYKFTATQTSLQLHAINDADVLFPNSNYTTATKYSLYTALYEYNIDGIARKKCFVDTANEVLFEDLEIGKEYYIKMMYAEINYLTDFEFQIALSNPTNLENTKFNLDNEISIYPNPVKDFLNFKTEHNILKVEVYDITGRILSSNSVSEYKIDLSNLKTGNYILKLYTEKGVKSTKIIKE